MNKNKIAIGILFMVIGLMSAICSKSFNSRTDTINKAADYKLNCILCYTIIYGGAWIVYNEINNNRKR